MKIIEQIKLFLDANGFTSVLVLMIAVVLFVFGFKVWAVLLVGVFIGRNWEIIKKLYQEHLKAKLNATIDNLKK